MATVVVGAGGAMPRLLDLEHAASATATTSTPARSLRTTGEVTGARPGGTVGCRVGRATFARMATYEYDVEAHSDAPPERVFALLADATSWPRWAGPLIGHGSWDRQGSPAPGGVGAIRKLGRWPVYAREQILEYDAPSHMAYTIVKGQPVRNYRADVELRAAGSGTTIVWHAAFEPLIPGTGALLRAFFRRAITRTATGLAANA
jgi:uncharacterized protein YndB with AHSA1/START domain